MTIFYDAKLEYTGIFDDCGNEEIVAKFRDINECIANGYSIDQIYNNSRNALQENILSRMDRNQCIPHPSKHDDCHKAIPLSEDVVDAVIEYLKNRVDSADLIEAKINIENNLELFGDVFNNIKPDKFAFIKCADS